jgi:hypothetical protein
VNGILEGARGADDDLSFGRCCPSRVAMTCPLCARRKWRLRPETPLGDWRLRQQQAACKVWPHFVAPPSYREPIHTQIPTMFVSGDSDGSTPLSFIEHAAPGFENRVEVVMSNRGHTEWAPCVETLYQRFLNQGSVRGLDASACSHLSNVPRSCLTP